ncbi:hypothetical protein JYT32_00260 [Dehalococcoides mccartyi]|nr:hypothetical protein [Dehalococcoides mccartyi]
MTCFEALMGVLPLALLLQEVGRHTGRTGFAWEAAQSVRVVIGPNSGCVSLIPLPLSFLESRETRPTPEQDVFKIPVCQG